MRALVIKGRQDLVVEDRPTPVPGDGQVLLRMAYAGICGSDLHYYFEGANGSFVVREPLIPGHEVSGTVASDPSGTYAAGTPVTVHPATFGPDVPGLEHHRHLRPGGSYLGSASTWPHTQGGMSEYLVVEADMIRPLPANLPLARAALAEPLAVALHGISLADDVAGKDVLVSGSGPIGLLTTFAVVALGAASVTATDVLDGPLSRAAALGAAETLRIGRDEIPANRYDFSFECSGVPSALSAVLAATRPAGTVVQIGMLAAQAREFELAPFVQKELRLFGSFRFNDEIGAAVEMLATHPNVDAVLTHTISADDATEAFAVAKDSEVSGKVLVDLWN